MMRAFTSLRARLRSLPHDETGSMVIETAIVAPVLVMLALGGFEASRIVARQTELQTAMGEAASIARAAAPKTQSERNTVRDILRSSAGLQANEVTIREIYRCGTAATHVTDKTTCSSSEKVSTYVEIVLTETYTPRWVNYGIGEPVSYRLQRTVFIS